MLDGRKRHGTLHERGTADGDVIVGACGEELVGNGVHEALDARRSIVGRDVQRTTRCTDTVLELLSAGKAFHRLRADDDIDLRAFRSKLVGEQLERRGTHATAGEQGATCAVWNVPAIADGTDEVDLVADDDM